MATRKSILLVADDLGRLAPLQSALRSGYSLVEATCEVATTRLRGGAVFDLLIIDIEPPELAFLEVSREYRQTCGAERPILALSGAFKRAHIEGMLENRGVRRLFPLNVSVPEMLFWVNQALFPEALRSRKTPRSPSSFALRVGTGESLTLEVRALNLSEDGLFLETGTSLTRGQIVDIRFELPGDPEEPAALIHAPCEVVWVNPESADGVPPFGIGLQFTDLAADSRSAIKRHVMRNLLESTI